MRQSSPGVSQQKSRVHTASIYISSRVLVLSTLQSQPYRLWTVNASNALYGSYSIKQSCASHRLYLEAQRGAVSMFSNNLRHHFSPHIIINFDQWHPKLWFRAKSNQSNDRSLVAIIKIHTQNYTFHQILKHYCKLTKIRPWVYEHVSKSVCVRVPEAKRSPGLCVWASV